MEELKRAKDRILAEVAKYETLKRKHQNKESWKPGDPIPYAGRVYGEEEVVAAVDSALDFWLTLGEHGKEFETRLAEYLGVKSSILVNSGSSANLVALATLTSHRIETDRRLSRGDQVITVAAGFPTTVAPILQNGCVPVFVDVNAVTGNIDCSKLEEAYEEGKTKAVVLAHALGNPFEIVTILNFCRKYNLWLVEDNCDALGSTYTMPINEAKRLGVGFTQSQVVRGGSHIEKKTGSWGDISTQSFYPPHHMTMGEGGCVNIVRDIKLRMIAESIRDWGRDCWCPSGFDDTCGKRYGWSLGSLPVGYDHKYIYSHLGYNLKPLDLQAAIGNVQLGRLDGFVAARRENWERLRSNLNDCVDRLRFSKETHAIKRDKEKEIIWDDSGCEAMSSWFGFKIDVVEGADARRSLAQELERHKIGNRMFFGGNLLRQPVFVEQLKNNPRNIRAPFTYRGSDEIMNMSLFVGTYPGLSHEMIDFMSQIIADWCKGKP